MELLGHSKYVNFVGPNYVGEALKTVDFVHYGNPLGELMNFLLDQVSTPRVNKKISEVNHITHDGEIRRYLKRSCDATQNQINRLYASHKYACKKIMMPRLYSDHVMCSL